MLAEGSEAGVEANLAALVSAAPCEQSGAILVYEPPLWASAAMAGVLHCGPCCAARARRRLCHRHPRHVAASTCWAAPARHCRCSPRVPYVLHGMCRRPHARGRPQMGRGCVGGWVGCLSGQASPDGYAGCCRLLTLHGLRHSALSCNAQATDIALASADVGTEGEDAASFAKCKVERTEPPS